MSVFVVKNGRNDNKSVTTKLQRVHIQPERIETKCFQAMQTKQKKQQTIVFLTTSVTTMERVLQGKKEQEVVPISFDITSCCAQDETRTHRK